MNRVLLAVMAAAVGIVGGYALAMLRSAAPPPGSPKAPASVRAPTADAFSYEAPKPQISPSEARDHRLTHYKELESVSAVLELPTDFAQTEALYAVAGRADEAQVQDLILDAVNIAHRYDRSAALGILFSRYAELDAPAALAFLQQLDLDIDTMVAQSLFSAWSKQDLAAAVAGSNQIANVRLRKQSGYTILTAIARTDPGMLDTVAAQLVDHHDTAWIESEMVGIEANYRPVDALTRALGMNMNRGGHDALRRVAVVWARNDPAAALAYAGNIDNHGQRQQFVSATVHRWMEDDPEAALQAILALPEGREKSQTLVSGLAGYAKTDPQRALAVADGLDASIRSQAYQRVFTAWAENDPDGAMTALTALKDTSLGQTVVASVMSNISSMNPDMALRFAQSMDAATRASVLPNILRQLTPGDPLRALELARGIESPEQRSRSLTAVLQHMSHSDPRLAARHIDELPSASARRQLYRQVANVLAQRDPNETLAWAESLGDEAYAAAVGGMGDSIANNDPDLAASMIGRIRGEARQAWIAAIANVYARSDPRRALSWASQYKDEPGYANAMSSVVVQLARSDPRAALRVAEDLPAGARGQAVYTALSGWAERDPRAAARYAAATGEDVRPGAVASVINSWIRQDSAAAERWAMSLRGAARDQALMIMAAEDGGGVPHRARLLNAMASDAQREQSAMLVYMAVRRNQGQQQAEAFLEAIDVSDAVRERLRGAGF